MDNKIVTILNLISEEPQVLIDKLTYVIKGYEDKIKTLEEANKNMEKDKDKIVMDVLKHWAIYYEGWDKTTPREILEFGRWILKNYEERQKKG